jgi:hypothetical protein
VSAGVGHVYIASLAKVLIDAKGHQLTLAVERLVKAEGQPVFNGGCRRRKADGHSGGSSGPSEEGECVSTRDGVHGYDVKEHIGFRPLIQVAWD